MSSYRNACFPTFQLNEGCPFGRGSVCLPDVTESHCLLNSEVLLLQQAWFIGVLSRHFRRVKMMQPSWFKKLFLVAFGLFNFLKSWVESYAGYWMTDLPSDSIPGGSNFLFSRRKRLHMRGGRGLQILACLTPGFLLICIKEKCEIYLVCLFNVIAFLESIKKKLYSSVINFLKKPFPCMLFYSYCCSKTQISEWGYKLTNTFMPVTRFSTSWICQQDITSMIVFPY